MTFFIDSEIDTIGPTAPLWIANSSIPEFIIVRRFNNFGLNSHPSNLLLLSKHFIMGNFNASACRTSPESPPIVGPGDEDTCFVASKSIKVSQSKPLGEDHTIRFGASDQFIMVRPPARSMNPSSEFKSDSNNSGKNESSQIRYAPYPLW